MAFGFQALSKTTTLGGFWDSLRPRLVNYMHHCVIVCDFFETPATAHMCTVFTRLICNHGSLQMLICSRRYTLRVRLGRLVGLSEDYIRTYRICALIHYAGQLKWVGHYDLMLHAEQRHKVMLIVQGIFPFFFSLLELRLSNFVHVHL